MLVSPALVQHSQQTVGESSTEVFFAIDTDSAKHSRHHPVTADTATPHLATTAAATAAATTTAVLKDYAKVIAAGVEVSNETLHLSDHFPVYFHWREATGWYRNDN